MRSTTVVALRTVSIRSGVASPITRADNAGRKEFLRTGPAAGQVLPTVRLRLSLIESEVQVSYIQRFLSLFPVAQKHYAAFYAGNRFINI
jgi:hypothetical protein